MTKNNPAPAKEWVLSINSLRNHTEDWNVKQGKVWRSGGKLWGDLNDSSWLKETFSNLKPEQAPSFDLQGHISHEPKQGHGIVAKLSLNLQAKAKLECVKCLEFFETDLEINEELDVALPEGEESQRQETPPAKGAGGSERRLDRTDLDQCECGPQGLHMEPVLLDALESAKPDYPQCSESCKGICVECGLVLNHGNCGLKHSPCPLAKDAALN